MVLGAALFGLAALYLSAGWGELSTQHSLESTGLNAARSEAAQVSNNGEGLFSRRIHRCAKRRPHGTTTAVE